MLGGPREEYIRGFERRNLLGTRKWNLALARRVAPEVWDSLEGRRVLVLGSAVRTALGLPPTRWILPHRDETGREWRLVPHPSGRNRLYNDPTMGLRVSMLLRDWMENYGKAV